MKSIIIYVVSDKPNDIGEMLVRAGISVFEKSIREVRLHPFVDDKIGIDSMLERAASKNGLIVYHFFSEELRNYFEQEAKKTQIPIYDARGSLVETLRGITGEKPVANSISDILLDPEYAKKVEAIEFAIRCDDGKNTHELPTADIILIGVSRTSKTPISIYLANRQYRVANIPLMPEIEPPKELFEIPREKIFGLILDPDRLVNIRSERIRSMGIEGQSFYGSRERVITELQKAQELFDNIGCTVIDVTSKAIEEIAAIILANVTRREV
ncbi:MAG: [pyruvate, water dikinase]-phosphate phosphotransferase / [pyruvate, water dikinase] kinase [Eubacteriaceae bacterium]|jgi:regulator of PEP synthase PpsR (kinase-PPPase family)|nr:[pyruvate, water dikinase]-phosphate phosphotransferase / [pyruvate, water dikinase] kinase [Eubacteriaceae bacterium]MDK2905945.1 [pyruvate, water dikinase]-phosphate phosphotransferase / [pyruvate, water dikinase] kinase [Eubacteriaceae bacterium]MDK2937255.1 [pyruvate, water dikinase]-phosphate phosphotransferase / [pyruvate, water dikinase] kinase [Eubacteriaceae bacterium]